MTSPLGDLPYLANLLMQQPSIPTPPPQPAIPDPTPAGAGGIDEGEEEEEEEEESEEDDSDDEYDHGGFGYRGEHEYERGGWDSDSNSEDEYINQLLDEDEFESTSEAGRPLGRRDATFRTFEIDATKVEIPAEWKGKGT